MQGQMKSLLFEFEWVVNIDHPIYENLPHLLSDLFLLVIGFWFLHFSHEIDDFLFVLKNGIFRLMHRAIGQSLLVTIQRTRSEFRLYFLYFGGDWHFLVDAHILLEPFIEVGDVTTEYAFVVLVVDF